MTTQTYAEHLLESLDQEPEQPAFSVIGIPQDTDVRYLDELFQDLAGRDKGERANIVRYRHARIMADNCARQYLDFLTRNGYVLLMDESMMVDRFVDLVNLCRSDLYPELPEWLLPEPIDTTKPLETQGMRLLADAYKKILGPGFEDAFNELWHLQKYDEETLKKCLQERGVLKENGAADHQVVCGILTSKD